MTVPGSIRSMKREVTRVGAPCSPSQFPSRSMCRSRHVAHLNEFGSPVAHSTSDSPGLRYARLGLFAVFGRSRDPRFAPGEFSDEQTDLTDCLRSAAMQIAPAFDMRQFWGAAQ